MNPLTWKRAHLFAWAVTIVAGALAGVIVGWLSSPFSRGQGGNTAALLIAWLHYPQAWWPFAAIGAVTGGLAYYSGDLLTGSR
jgi:hypothetical protein